MLIRQQRIETYQKLNKEKQEKQLITIKNDSKKRKAQNQMVRNGNEVREMKKKLFEKQNKKKPNRE